MTRHMYTSISEIQRTNEHQSTLPFYGTFLPKTKDSSAYTKEFTNMLDPRLGNCSNLRIVKSSDAIPCCLTIVAAETIDLGEFNRRWIRLGDVALPIRRGILVANSTCTLIRKNTQNVSVQLILSTPYGRNKEITTIFIPQSHNCKTLGKI